jgi:hypothetical protein
MLPNVPTSKRTYKVNNIVKSAVDQRWVSYLSKQTKYCRVVLEDMPLT